MTERDAAAPVPAIVSAVVRAVVGSAVGLAAIAVVGALVRSGGADRPEWAGGVAVAYILLAPVAAAGAVAAADVHRGGEAVTLPNAVAAAVAAALGLAVFTVVVVVALSIVAGVDASAASSVVRRTSFGWPLPVSVGLAAVAAALASLGRTRSGSGRRPGRGA